MRWPSPPGSACRASLRQRPDYPFCRRVVPGGRTTHNRQATAWCSRRGSRRSARSAGGPAGADVPGQPSGVRPAAWASGGAGHSASLRDRLGVLRLTCGDLWARGLDGSGLEQALPGRCASIIDVPAFVAAATACAGLPVPAALAVVAQLGYCGDDGGCRPGVRFPRTLRSGSGPTRARSAIPAGDLVGQYRCAVRGGARTGG